MARRGFPKDKTERVVPAGNEGCWLSRGEDWGKNEIEEGDGVL